MVVCVVPLVFRKHLATHPFHSSDRYILLHSELYRAFYLRLSRLLSLSRTLTEEYQISRVLPDTKQ